MTKPVMHRLPLRDEAKVTDVPVGRLDGAWIVARDFPDGRRYWAGGSHPKSAFYWCIDAADAAHYATRAEASDAAFDFGVLNVVLISV